MKSFLLSKLYILSPGIFIVFIILLFLSPLLLSNGVPITHDGENHLVRFAAYQKAFQDGHIPPRWAGDLNYSYGVPVFNFFYPLPGYIASFLGLFSFSIETRFTMICILALLISALSFYGWSIEYVRKSLAVVVSLLYALAPYQLLNLYVRGDIGELLAYAFVPAVLYFADRFYLKQKISYGSFTAWCLALVILSHHGVGMMMVPGLSLYILIRWKKLSRGIIKSMFAICLALGISSFFWLPALVEQRYTLPHILQNQIYGGHFLGLFRAIISEWKYGANVNALDGQSPQLGLVAVVIGILTLLKITAAKQKSLVFLFISMASIGLFLTLAESTFLWRHIPLLPKYQFPWRFMGMATVGLLGSIVVLRPTFPKWAVVLFLLAILLQASLQAKPYAFTTHPDSYYQHFPGTTFFHEEAIPRWTAGSASSYAKEKVEVISGKTAVQIIEQKTHRITMKLTDTDENTRLKVNTLYYPGWEAWVDGKEVPIEFQDMNNRGVLTFSVPQGSRDVVVVFGETKTRLIANILSLGSFSLMVIMAFSPKVSYLEHLEGGRKSGRKRV